MLPVVAGGPDAAAGWYVARCTNRTLDFEGRIMIALIITATAHIYAWLHWLNPINHLADTAHHRPHWWHPPTAIVVSAVCWIGALTITGMLAEGSPKWWYLTWFLLMWNGLKALLLVPFSLYWLAKTKIVGALQRRRETVGCTAKNAIT